MVEKAPRGQRDINIPWEVFPKKIVPALKGVLDELDVSTSDRDPRKTRFLRREVERELGILGARFMPDLAGYSMTNKEIADTFKSLASRAGESRSEELRSVFESISSMAEAFIQPRTPGAKKSLR